MKYKLLIEYDGTGFCGWQRQKDGIAVQQVLEDALATALRHPVTLFGSGRTDTGVHAMAQVAHFETDVPIKPDVLRESLNALVRPYAVSVKVVEAADDDFHARFSAKERTYLYRILNTPFPPALDNNRVWWYKYPLDVDAMNRAAQLLVGRHDFSTFRASECQAKSPVKTLNEIHLERVGDEIHMHVKAKSFLHHQVRNIIGSLVQVGCGKWTVDDFAAAFAACDRRRGGQTAPAQGLYFIAVTY